MSATTYTFSVDAYDAAGNVSTRSNIAAATTLPTGLVAYYTFTDNANDMSGDGYTGTVNGASLTADRFGNASGAYSFNGTSDYIGLSNTSSLNFGTGGFTLAAWAKFTADNLDVGIVGKHVCGSDPGYFLGVGGVYNSTEKNSFQFHLNSNDRVRSSEKYNDGRWHFVVSTYNGATQYLYVDGILKDAHAMTYTKFTNIDISIGRLGTNCVAGNFNGLIDDVGIYNRALSESEIVQLYIKQRPNSAAPLIPDTGQTTRYSTAFGDDSDYSIYSPSYTDNGNGTITDNIAGLLWQKQDDGISRDWTSASSVCDTLNLGGYSTGWRLPTPVELATIVNYGIDNPAVNSTYFISNSNAVASYWSSYSYIGNSSMAWYVSFGAGFMQFDGKISNNRSRCVYGNNISNVYVDNGNGTITNSANSLMWQKQDDGSLRTWENAISYCENLSLAGHTDWRLPNIKELASLVDFTAYGPAIDTNYFSNVQSSLYWTSTTIAYNTPRAWSISFLHGGMYDSYDKTNAFYVRCVR